MLQPPPERHDDAINILRPLNDHTSGRSRGFASHFGKSMLIYKPIAENPQVLEPGPMDTSLDRAEKRCLLSWPAALNSALGQKKSMVLLINSAAIAPSPEIYD